MSDVNRQWVLARRPEGMVEQSNFELVESPVPAIEDGQVLVRNLYLSFEPAMRGWIEDAPNYMPPVAIGEVMRASAVGQIVASKHGEWKPGDYAYGLFGWQDYAVVAPDGIPGLTRVPEGRDLTDPLGRLGMTSLTAYFGLLDIGEPREGETVVVSGAAGATGSVAAQIAKIRGCRVVGIAGGDEKCAWLRDEARLDAVVDHRSEDVMARLGDLCPDRIDIAFDNVGGETLDAFLFHIADHARIVLCGAISNYNLSEPTPQLRYVGNLIKRRGKMQGFIVIDYLARAREALEELTRWVDEGRIAFRVDIQEGMENVPRTFLRLFSGENKGKQLCRIAEAPIS